MNFESLFDDTPAPRKRGRQREEPPAPVPEEDESLYSFEAGNANGLLNGVSVATLCRLFRVRKAAAERRLRDCPPIRRGATGTPYYDIAEAARYLVDPVINLEEYLNDLTIEALPIKFQDAYWKAQERKDKVMALRGQLWHDDAIHDMLASTFTILKNVVKLWPDSAQKMFKLNDDDRKKAMDMADALLNEVYDKLSKFADEDRTSNLRDLEDDNGELPDDED